MMMMMMMLLGAVPPATIDITHPEAYRTALTLENGIIDELLAFLLLIL